MNPSNSQISQRILVIDDNASIHADFRKILVSSGADGTELRRAAAGLLGTPVTGSRKQSFELRSTFQGQEGLAAVEESMRSSQPFDMAFVDMRMPPGWDGIQTIRHLWQADPGLQIVICTAYSDYDFEQIVSHLGLSDQFVILKKPFDSVEVRQLANALAQKRALLQTLREHVADLEETIRKNAQLEETLRKNAEALRMSEEQFRLITENAADLIGIVGLNGGLLYSSPSYEKLFGERPNKGSQEQPLERVHPEDRAIVIQSIRHTIESRSESVLEYRVKQHDGSWRYLEAHGGPFRDAAGKVDTAIFVARDITDRRLAEMKLRQTQKELVEASHLAGMAEVATSVLHNVGNVLNSVNVSTGLISSQLKNSKTGSIARVAALIREHASDLPDFLNIDPRGRQLPEFLSRLAEHLTQEQTAMLEEMELIRKNVEHIEHIVGVQQNCARKGSGAELLSIASFVEDALRMNEGSLRRRKIQVLRDYAPDVPCLVVEKHKLLQILVNLIRNAEHACDESGQADKQLKVSVGLTADRQVRLALADNGVGIAPENLSRIFSHGFTTRKEGHGFGLHSAVRAAQEMGATLAAHSDGLGQGATFTLVLPVPIGAVDSRLCCRPS